MIEIIDAWFPYFLVFVQALIAVVSCIFLISGLDDLFVDGYFVMGRFARLFRRPAKLLPGSEQELLALPEKKIAVLIPAWDESAVIRPMLENTLATLNYSEYRVFVGAYPNDPATQAEVQKVQQNHSRVELVLVPHDGPTNKADCLNSIYKRIGEYEKKHGGQFQIFVMQDCEDLIHPLCYKLFNFVMPEKDMVQLPVVPLRGKWWEFTGGHYIDEFAQGHYKDITVRQSLDRNIPSAGVGTAFSRHACEVLFNANDQKMFNTSSLTEDYHLGLSFKQHGLSTYFANFYLSREVVTPLDDKGNYRKKRVKEYVCIREYFPSTFYAAVKQKSRWVVGIVFQGWSTIGWRGSIARKYMLFRDRKAVLTNLANGLGYLIVLIVVALYGACELFPGYACYPTLIEEGSLSWYLILANAGLFVWRLLVRAFCVLGYYDWREALLSAPRMIWGNFINFAATVRACRLYLRYLRTGRFIAWDKTAHRYINVPAAASPPVESGRPVPATVPTPPLLPPLPVPAPAKVESAPEAATVLIASRPPEGHIKRDTASNDTAAAISAKPDGESVSGARVARELVKARPSAAAFRIGILLLHQKLITTKQLDEALRRQRAKRRPLGTILREMGALSDNDLAFALQLQQSQ